MARWPPPTAASVKRPSRRPRGAAGTSRRSALPSGGHAPRADTGDDVAEDVAEAGARGPSPAIGAAARLPGTSRPRIWPRGSGRDGRCRRRGPRTGWEGGREPSPPSPAAVDEAPQDVRRDIFAGRRRLRPTRPRRRTAVRNVVDDEATGKTSRESGRAGRAARGCCRQRGPRTGGKGRRDPPPPPAPPPPLQTRRREGVASTRRCRADGRPSGTSSTTRPPERGSKAPPPRTRPRDGSRRTLPPRMRPRRAPGEGGGARRA